MIFKPHLNFDENPFVDWLYSDWSEEKYSQYLMLNAFGPTRDYMNYLLDKRSDAEYMNKNQISYSDIHDPRNLRQSSSYGHAIASSQLFISKNIDRLYKD